MPQSETGKRPRRNRPFPTFNLEDVLKIARTIHQVNSGLPMDRELLAAAMRTTTSSSGFRMRLNSSAKYGLTKGGYRDDRISLTDLGRAAVAPAGADEMRSAYRTAAATPEVFRRFYSMLAGKSLPEDVYSRNILARDLGVHPELTAQCLDVLIANGRFAGLLGTEDGRMLVARDASPADDGKPPRAAPAGSVHARQGSRRPSAPADGNQPRVFLGCVGESDVGDVLRDNLMQLGVQVDYRVTAAGAAVHLPSDVSDAMEGCAAGIVIEGAVEAIAPEAAGAVMRSTWLLLGAATLMYGPNVVLIEAADGDPVDLPGIRHVRHDRHRPDATVLSTIMALRELGVVRVVGGAASSSE